jgi:ribokinase
MKILNFGSLNIDYVYNVEHFVRPGETISSQELKTFCGGKGLNQSIAIAKAGALSYHAGCIGKDGEMLKEALQNNKVNTNYIEYADCPSGHAIIQVDKTGQNCIILFSGANNAITEKYVDKVLSNFEKDDILLIQNEINCIPYIMEKSYKKGLKIVLNPSPINEKIKELPLRYVSYFILNEIEGNEITGQTEAEKILDELLSRYPESSVVLTLGKNGVTYRDKNIYSKHGIYDVRVVDTTAAGDTFTGYFLALLTEGLAIEKILEKASIASSISVSRAGAANSIPLRNEVEESNLIQK